MTRCNGESAELLSLPTYGLSAAEKARALLPALQALTELHNQRCPPYAQALRLLHPAYADATRVDELPYLPVRVFKTRMLRSIPEHEVFKVLTSSGTTGQVPSRIYLDRETAARQTRALAQIMTSLLGPRRLPMVLVDSKSVLRDRQSFSARGAGLLGMANFGRDHFYALDDDLCLDEQGLGAFLARHAGAPLLIFGFTFMIWSYFLPTVARSGLDLSRAVLVHSGGWKKLVDQAVDGARFRAALRAACGLQRVHDFYGMVEQVGSVFLECEAGVLHAPSFADVIVRDARTLAPAPFGREGLIQVLSALPTSYPGHSLLTEDLGTLLGEDDCPCGKRGRYFRVRGRVPRAELRGCSDTYAGESEARGAA